MATTNVTSPVEYEYASWINIRVPPVLLVLGIVGNLLSGVIWIRVCLREPSSTYVYLAVLSGADSIVLVVGLFRKWIQAYTGYDATAESELGCRLFTVAGYLFTDYSVWLIVAVTAERYLRVKHGLKSDALSRMRRSTAVTLFLFVFLLSINSHLFVTAGVTSGGNSSGNYSDPCGWQGWNDSQPRCGARPGYELLVASVWPYVDLCLYSILPFILLLVLNSFIIRTVSSAAALRKQYTCSPAAAAGHIHSPSETKITVMLLTISFTFLLTTLPMNVVVILNSYWNANFSQLDCDQQSRLVAKMTLATSLSRVLMWTNHSINFYLYCLTGRKFRREMARLCSQCRALARRGEDRQKATQPNYQVQLTPRAQLIPQGEVIPLPITRKHHFRSLPIGHDATV